VPGSKDLAELAVRAAEYGERELVVATVAGTIPRPPAATVRDPRFPAFSIDLHVQDLGRGQELELPPELRRHGPSRPPGRTP